MPADWTTTLTLMAATLAAGLATLAALARLRGRTAMHRVERVGVLFVLLTTAGLLIYRAVAIHETWAPLQAHIDGLVLLIALIALITGYLQFTGRLRGADLFLLPIATLLCMWSICASWWTYYPFQAVATIWDALHVVSVYLGMAGVTAAAAIGALYLYVQHQLKRRDDPADAFRRLRNLTSLETLDRWVTRSATIGFILLTVAVATGVVIEFTAEGRSEPMHRIKIAGAVISWITYGLLIHVPFAPSLRGRRAAQLAVAGFFILLVVMGIAVALPGHG
jgi:ABC-type uncharacterized transport system permease subunit